MSPSVSRKSSEPKIRPYIRQSLVEASRRKFPDFEGSDADFIEWVLASLNAGVLSFYGQLLPQVRPTEKVNHPTQTPEPTEPQESESQQVNLLDEDAD